MTNEGLCLSARDVVSLETHKTSTNTCLAPLGFPPLSKIIQVRLSHSGGVAKALAALG